MTGGFSLGTIKTVTICGNLLTYTTGSVYLTHSNTTNREVQTHYSFRLFI